MSVIKIPAAMAALAACALLSGCTPASDQHGNGHAKPESAAKDRTAMNAPQRAFAEANDRMHRAMGANIPADPDVAFMVGMIPHHQGAVDMAKILLEHGKDPEARALAETVIKTQTAEIAQMQAWLAKRGVGASAAPTDAAAVDHSKMGH